MVDGPHVKEWKNTYMSREYRVIMPKIDMESKTLLLDHGNSMEGIKSK